ncbi:tachykinin-4 isoform X2 [Arvicanthis niloticus]|uniref:tachykinin-4 isoform X2 n=1 Tax=Arvicanthis niloticus TaxID=61156 RepID=UPI00402B0971
METEDGKSTEKEELGWERSISSDRLANHERTENAGRKHYTASSHGGCPWQAVISRSHILRHCAPVTGGNSAKVCTTAGDREELAFGADAESWVTVNLKVKTLTQELPVPPQGTTRRDWPSEKLAQPGSWSLSPHSPRMERTLSCCCCMVLGHGIPIPSIELQLQELKRSRTRQFYGLMGKRVEGIHPIQSTERMGYQLGRIVEDLLGTRSLSIQGTCRQETSHQSAGPGALARESFQSQEEDETPLTTSNM